MGISPSRPNGPAEDRGTRLRNVFAKELSHVTDVVDHVLTKDNLFASEEYNFLGKAACDRFTFVLQSKLRDHLKVDLKDLRDSIIFIPKQDRTSTDNAVIAKHDMCRMISAHYTKCLYVLCLVRYVYDTEHGGDHSVAGIVRRNIRMVGSDLMEINYCALPQKDYARADKLVDLGQLQGLRFFVEHFLSPEERHTFFEQLRMAFGRHVSPSRVQALACQDAVLTARDFKEMYGVPVICKGVTKKAAPGDLGTAPTVVVAEGNPILSSSMCMSKKKLVVNLGSDRDSRALRDAYHALGEEYRSGIEKLSDLLARLVDKDRRLKNISDVQLEDLTTDIKRAVLRFYIAPLLGYQRLLDLAKTMPSIRLDV